MDYYFWVTTRRIKPDTREQFEQSWRPAEFPGGPGGSLRAVRQGRQRGRRNLEPKDLIALGTCAAHRMPPAASPFVRDRGVGRRSRRPPRALRAAQSGRRRAVHIARRGQAQASRTGTLVIEPANARAQRPQRRGPTGRPAARRRPPASPREPPAFRRGDRVVRRFAHALRLRGALASRARSPCSHAPSPCERALGRPTGHSGCP